MTRTVAVLIVLVAGLAASSASIFGADAASHRAASAPRSASFPSWSPDGKQILFGQFRWGQFGTNDVRIVRRSSRPGGAIRIVHAASHDHYPEPLFWARGRIVFRDDNSGDPGYSVGLHGGKPQPIALPGYPQGFILTPRRAYAAAVIQDTHGPASIALLKLRPGRNPVVIPTPLAAQERSGAISDYILSFSPHGRQLIFMRYSWRNPCDDYSLYGCETGPAALMAFRLGSGRAPVPLARSGLGRASLVPSDAQQVHWSPDGRWIAFVQNRSLAVVPTSGASPPRVLPPCPAPDFPSGFSWSPTSKLIAYECESGNDGLDGAELMTVRPDGTHFTNPLAHRPLTYVNDTGTGHTPAQWSPNGSRLLFLAHRGPRVSLNSHPTIHVWTIRPDGHHLTRLG